MYYSVIKNCDIANGPGVRVVLFVSGCRHHCPGCFQPQTWDFSYGQPFTQDTVDELLRLLQPDYIAGLTLLGGEPMRAGEHSRPCSIWSGRSSRLTRKKTSGASLAISTTILLPEKSATVPSPGRCSAWWMSWWMGNLYLAGKKLQLALPRLRKPALDRPAQKQNRPGKSCFGPMKKRGKKHANAPSRMPAHRREAAALCLRQRSRGGSLRLPGRPDRPSPPARRSYLPHRHRPGDSPAGFAGLIYARSGLACKQGLAPANKVGVIDPDYRGKVLIALHNHSDAVRTVEPGDRIAQLILTPYLTADFQLAEDLTETDRGAGGFGSTGGK